MATLITPNMNLAVPVVGVEPGPTWASDINSCMSVIDQHDHSAGNGVQITPNGININSELSFGNNNAIDLKSVRFQVQDAVLTDPDDLTCLYSVGVDLYFNDGNGNNIQITASGGVAGTPGSIANLVSPASASYVALNQTFVWESDASTAANMDCGSIIIREVLANAKGITLSSPASLAADYSITFPSALPGSQKFATLDASGNLAAPWAVDNSTLEIASSTTLQIKDGGVTGVKLNSNVVDNSTLQLTSNQLSIKNLGVTAAKIANATITGTQVSSNINLAGKAVQENGNNIIVSLVNASTYSLAILRTGVQSGGSAFAGEGITSSRITTGVYGLSYAASFLDFPIVIVTPDVSSTSTNIFAAVRSVTANNCEVVVSNTSGALVDCQFYVMIIGQRT